MSMDILSTVVDFNTLSMQDLLRARDQFHPHLMHKANVIGTAVGRYRIRKGDADPSAALAMADRSTPERGKEVVKQPRTLANSEVRPNSWPCILVLVKQ